MASNELDHEKIYVCSKHELVLRPQSKINTLPALTGFPAIAAEDEKMLVVSKDNRLLLIEHGLEFQCSTLTNIEVANFKWYVLSSNATYFAYCEIKNKNRFTFKICRTEATKDTNSTVYEMHDLEFAPSPPIWEQSERFVLCNINSLLHIIDCEKRLQLISFKVLNQTQFGWGITKSTTLSFYIYFPAKPIIEITEPGLLFVFELDLNSHVIFDKPLVCLAKDFESLKPAKEILKYKKDKFEGIDEIEIKFSPSKKHIVLNTTIFVDPSGLNYGSITKSYLLTEENFFSVNNASKIDLSKLKTVSMLYVRDVAWAPNYDLVAYISQKGRAFLIDPNGKLIHSFIGSYKNTISWSPHGDILLLGGFGNLAGDITLHYFDYTTSTPIITNVAAFRAACTVSCSWSPDSRFILTAVTQPRMMIDNAFTVWNREGEKIYTESIEALTSVDWLNNLAKNAQPAPAKPVSTYVSNDDVFNDLESELNAIVRKRKPRAKSVFKEQINFSNKKHDANTKVSISDAELAKSRNNKLLRNNKKLDKEENLTSGSRTPDNEIKQPKPTKYLPSKNLVDNSLADMETQQQPTKRAFDTFTYGSAQLKTSEFTTIKNPNYVNDFNHMNEIKVRMPVKETIYNSWNNVPVRTVPRFWFYLDLNMNEHGPFEIEIMRNWWQSGRFPPSLMVRPASDPNFNPVYKWFRMKPAFSS